VRTIPDLLDRAVERFGDRPAMWHDGRRWTFAELGAGADRVAAWLGKRGVQPGDRVAVRLPNDPAFAIWAHGVWRAGAALVSINPLYAREAATAILSDSGARVLLTIDDGVTLDADTVVTDLHADVLTCGAPLERTEIDAYDLAVLQYTGGTTGAPTGAMLTHGNLVAGQRQLAARCPELVPGEERLFSAVPMTHVSGLVLAVLASVYLAAQMLIVPRFTPDEAVRVADELRPTFFPIVPTMATALLRLEPGPPERWSSLKVITAGAAPLAVDLQRRFEALTGCAVRPSYGGTETSAIATLTPSGGATPGSSGSPMPDTTIEIRSLEHASALVEPGEVGEIAVRGPQVAKGYWNRPDETAEFFADGAFRSGDLGHVDEAGFLHVVDRLKDMIIASGYNVYPATVERAVHTHRAVADVIVIGVPDEYRGEDVQAVVVLNPGHSLTLEELQTHLRGRLSPMELPRRLEIRDELPKTAVGKLSRKALREAAAHGDLGATAHTD
jgi:long-chain acyl-CoA synthetase